MFRYEIKEHLLHFSFPAHTSRNTFLDRKVWFIHLSHTSLPQVTGMGECAPLNGLSKDNIAALPEALTGLLEQIKHAKLPADAQEIEDLLAVYVPTAYPSLRMGLEMALLDLLHQGKRVYFPKSKLWKGGKIPINGLIWMGDKDLMWKRIEEKIAQGHTCLKIKIGGLDFDTECEILATLRKDFSKEIVVRLDANGAFEPEDCMEKLEVLSEYNIHSIEQPIPAGSWSSIRKIIKRSAIPVALDEELINIPAEHAATALQKLSPHYIVLKPSLLGGFFPTQAWIKAAENKKIGWWITSALESSVGLYALAQFVGLYPLTNELPQGLGTGKLYTNNLPSFLEQKESELFLAKPKA